MALSQDIEFGFVCSDKQFALLGKGFDLIGILSAKISEFFFCLLYTSDAADE